MVKLKLRVIPVGNGPPSDPQGITVAVRIPPNGIPPKGVRRGIQEERYPSRFTVLINPNWSPSSHLGGHWLAVKGAAVIAQDQVTHAAEGSTLAGETKWAG